MSGYVYRGNQPDTIPHGGIRTQCGTPWGYQLHINKSEEACEPCRESHRLNMHRWYPPNPPRKPPEHGTVAGHSRHRRYGEEPCDPCRAANNARISAWRDKRRAEQEQSNH